MLEPPDPSDLVALRQRWISKRFAVRVIIVVLYGAMFVNMVGLIYGAILYRRPLDSLQGWLVVLLGLPTLGVLGVVWVANRQGQAAVAAARSVLGMHSRPLSRLLYFGLLGAIILSAVVLLRLEGTLGNAFLFCILGMGGALMRRILDPFMPIWGLLLIVGWTALSIVWMLASSPAVGQDAALGIAVLWFVLSPFGLPVLLLRNVIAQQAERQDGVGRFARAWAIFLPPVLAARVLHRGTADVFDGLKAKLLMPLWGFTLAEALGELGELLLEMGDPRATALFTAASQVSPGSARPFMGLARALRSEDPRRALAYAEFAEDNAVRGLVGGSPAAKALREELQGAIQNDTLQ